ncbi:MAG: YbbR-like domain-containing protein [Bacteroidales bacterium]|nr:YbbR-like domain-containing protein [Bacteroidales bacterium]
MPRLGDWLKRMVGEWKTLLFSLLFAFFIWAMYYTSLTHSDFIQCEVTVATDMPGYASTAEANEILTVRGKASGFNLLKMSIRSNMKIKVRLAIEGNKFEKLDDSMNLFKLSASDIFEVLSDGIDQMFELDYIENEALTFNFSRQSGKMVPVVAYTDISCKPQFTVVGTPLLRPDSVAVYGKKEEIETIEQVYTKFVSLDNLDKSISTEVRLEVPSNATLSSNSVNLNLEVVRYVEHTERVPIYVVNNMAGRAITLIPSKVDISYWVKFANGNEEIVHTPEVYIDFQEYQQSRSGKVLPHISTTDSLRLLSFKIEPPIIECYVSF